MQVFALRPALVETNSCNKAVYYYNCASYFQVSLHDPTIFNISVLNIHLTEIKFQQEKHVSDT